MSDWFVTLGAVGLVFYLLMSLVLFLVRLADYNGSKILYWTHSDEKRDLARAVLRAPFWPVDLLVRVNRGWQSLIKDATKKEEEEDW